MSKYTYLKKFNYSHAVGVYTTLELLHKMPENVLEVVVSQRGQINAGVEKILQLCKKHNIKVTYNDNLVQKMSKSSNNYAVGIFKKFDTKLNTNNNHLVLFNPSNMGNTGTIIRTSLAFNCKDIAVIRPAVDIFDPKVIRGSMGAVFNVNIEYFKDFYEYRNIYGNNRNFYLFDESAQKSLEDIKFKKPWGLIFGNEGEGIDKRLQNVGQLVKIPQSNKVDSLNLSIAAGIVLYKSSFE